MFQGMRSGSALLQGRVLMDGTASRAVCKTVVGSARCKKHRTLGYVGNHAYLMHDPSLVEKCLQGVLYLQFLPR